MSNNISVHYVMRREPDAHVECAIQQGVNGSPAFAFLDIGRSISALPSIEQLIQIRDAISACLETPEAQALLPVPLRTVKRANSAPNPRLGLDVEKLLLALEVSTGKLALAQRECSHLAGYFDSCIEHNQRLILQARGETA